MYAAIDFQVSNSVNGLPPMNFMTSASDEIASRAGKSSSRNQRSSKRSVSSLTSLIPMNRFLPREFPGNERDREANTKHMNQHIWDQQAPGILPGISGRVDGR